MGAIIRAYINYIYDGIVTLGLVPTLRTPSAQNPSGWAALRVVGV